VGGGRGRRGEKDEGRNIEGRQAGSRTHEQEGQAVSEEQEPNMVGVSSVYMFMCMCAPVCMCQFLFMPVCVYVGVCGCVFIRLQRCLCDSKARH
jgi:hypothetical protein